MSYDFLDQYFTNDYHAELADHTRPSHSNNRVVNDSEEVSDPYELNDWVELGSAAQPSSDRRGQQQSSPPTPSTVQSHSPQSSQRQTGRTAGGSSSLATATQPPLTGGKSGVSSFSETVNGVSVSLPPTTKYAAALVTQSLSMGSYGSVSSNGSPVGHRHSDTYETSLPLEAMGARELVAFLYTAQSHGVAFSPLAPPDAQMQSKSSEVGLPLQLASEPVNPQTGRRLVYFSRGQAPQSVLAEPKNRFIAVAFKPLVPLSSTATEDHQLRDYPTCYGTILGYSNDNTAIVWHDRSERFASRVSLADILIIQRAPAMRCRNCGLVLLGAELREHQATHKRGAGVELGVFMDDPTMGMACGDTGLLQCMVDPRPLGEGAQGVVELCSVKQPTAAEEARVATGSMAYRYTSKHMSPNARLQQAVLKTMKFDSSEEALLQYQKSVRFMTVMDHPHLVEYLGVQLRPDHTTLCIAMPFYSEGDLASVIRAFRGDHFEESFVCSVALQLSLALSFLHERNPPIVHGDIKVENVMFYNNKEQIVLMDLDASCEVRAAQAVRTALGTTAYMAPETLNNERLMPASDMWSMGVLLYVLTVLPDFPMITNPETHNMDLLNASTWATKEDLHSIEEYLCNTNSGSYQPEPHDGSTRSSAAHRVSLGDCVRANVGERGYSAALTQLIVELLSFDPRKRPKAEDVGDRLTEIMTNHLLS